MISFVLMAAMSIAPEADANIFKRRAPAACNNCAAPAPCNGCAAPACEPCSGAAPAAPGAAAPVEGEKAVAPPAAMPKGDKAVPAPAPMPEKKVEEKKAEAPIQIPANLQDAINKSDQKTQIMDYLNNTAVPREKRIEYLETVRQTLLPDSKKEEKK